MGQSSPPATLATPPSAEKYSRITTWPATIPALSTLRDGVTAPQIPALDMRCNWKRKGLRESEAVSALETMVADEPRRNLFAVRHRGHHRRGVVVVTIGLVPEAPAICKYADHGRLRAIDDMREVTERSVGVLNFGYGRPGDGNARSVTSDPPADSPRRIPSPEQLCGGSARCSRTVGVRAISSLRRCMSLETAGGGHNAFHRANLDVPLCGFAIRPTTRSRPRTPALSRRR